MLANFRSGQDEATAQIADISGEGAHLIVIDTFPIDIAENDQIVSIELVDGGRHLSRIEALEARIKALEKKPAKAAKRRISVPAARPKCGARPPRSWK